MAKQNTQWSVSGNSYRPVEISGIVPKLENGIYKVNSHPMMGIWLDKLGDGFTFKHKIYGIEERLIAHVLRSYKGTNGNMGVLLNGTKGTGKSVTAKLLANKLDIPVILVEDNLGGALTGLLAQIHQDIVVFIDEYEKVFSKSGPDDEEAGREYNEDRHLLTLMDGANSAATNGCRKTFLLTTNKLWISDSLLQRPSRIRFLKEFKSLSSMAVREIVADLVGKSKLADDLVDFISRLEIVTVDIVQSLCSEAIIHGVSPENFHQFLNVKKLELKCNIWVDNGDGTEVLLFGDDTEVLRRGEDQLNVGFWFFTRYGAIGKIEKVEGNTFTVRLVQSVLDYKQGETVKFKLDRQQGRHESFAGEYDTPAPKKGSNNFNLNELLYARSVKA